MSVSTAAKEQAIAAKQREIKTFVDGLSHEEKAARFDGNFFSNLDELWEQIATPVDRDWYDAIVRTPTQGRVLYSTTVSDRNLRHPMAAMTESSSTHTNQKSETFDLFRNSEAEKAYLLSNEPLCHKAYGFIAEAATGKRNGDGAGSRELRLKLLNGAKIFDEKSKISDSGIKHHKHNNLIRERTMTQNRQP
jgi:hypothetical protein